MVFQLTDKLAFPDPHYGDPDGLLAVGGDLSIDRLILAYSNGIFPWYAFREELIQWWCPMDRFVIFPDEIHISHSMRTLINKGKYEITFNEAFEDVIQTCGELRMEQEGAWLGTKMMEAYTHLHEQGFAASVATFFCLMLSTFAGLPVSTTHTNTTAIMGVGAAKRKSAVKWGIAIDMVKTWVLTFPGCGLLGFAFAHLFLMFS